MFPDEGNWPANVPLIGGYFWANEKQYYVTFFCNHSWSLKCRKVKWRIKNEPPLQTALTENIFHYWICTKKLSKSKQRGGDVKD